MAKHNIPPQRTHPSEVCLINMLKHVLVQYPAYLIRVALTSYL